MFVLLDSLTGRYLPGRFSWQEARSAQEAAPFSTIVRLDEVVR